MAKRQKQRPILKTVLPKASKPYPGVVDVTEARKRPTDTLEDLPFSDGIINSTLGLLRPKQGTLLSGLRAHYLPSKPEVSYAPKSLEDEKRHLKSELDRIERWIRSNPALEEVFARHALGKSRPSAPTTLEKTSAPEETTLPDMPTERFRPRGKEKIIPFLKRVWRPYLYYGFAAVEDIRKLDPAAYAAIPWPKVTYAESLDSDVEQFLRDNWSDLIAVGVATRKVVRERDDSLENAITYRQGKHSPASGKLPEDIRPPTKSDLNDRALTAKAVPKRHVTRLAAAQINRLRGA